MILAATQHLAVPRSTLFAQAIRFAGRDLTGAIMKLQIRAVPDAPGAALIGLATVAVPGAQGLRLLSVDLTGPVPVSIVEIRIAKAAIQALAAAPELGENLVLAYAMLVQLPGGDEEEWLRGRFTVLASAAR